MTIISAPGGSGSTFVYRSLDRMNYRVFLFGMDPYPTKIRLERYLNLLSIFQIALRMINLYQPKIKVLVRPDHFWTERNNKTGTYDPESVTYPQDLREHRAYIIDSRRVRSAGIKIPPSALRDDSLDELVLSYVDEMKQVERRAKRTIVLLSRHWGEYGVFKRLGLNAVYLVRDPFNSLVSHSKEIRHRNDYQVRGFRSINTKEWIDAYLSGPVHWWHWHAKIALEHQDATIVRYHRFVEDWKNVKDLPNIGNDFVYTENMIPNVLSRESTDYIYEQTRDVCDRLGFDDIYKRIVG